ELELELVVAAMSEHRAVVGRGRGDRHNVRVSLRIPGMDTAGVVEAVGADVTAFRPGDEVIALLGADSARTPRTCVSRKEAPSP
ncbi:MAG TPA: alcohol dehydrogenase catalytic domain-containing protein, partial [Marisediminicola sp.]|nr:alcohol dehydrogenase catalytic domain-containing protein [Marisediminicola sp.]